MNSLEFQKKLNNAWAEILAKIKKDKKFGPGATIKAHDIFWFTINKNELPGVIINLKEKNSFSNISFPKARGWSFFTNNNSIKMNVNNQKYTDFFIQQINQILVKIFLENLAGKKSIKCFLDNLISAKDFFAEDNVPRTLTK